MDTDFSDTDSVIVLPHGTQFQIGLYHLLLGDTLDHDRMREASIFHLVHTYATEPYASVLFLSQQDVPFRL